MSGTGRFEGSGGIAGGAVPGDRPVLLLDFDGVLNVFHRHDFDPLHAIPEPITDAYGIDVDTFVTVPAEDGSDGWSGDARRSEPRRYRLTFSSELISDVASAVDAGLLSVVWLTSWKGLAPEILEPVTGLRPDGSGRAPFPYADWRYRGFSDTGSYGKAGWVDDAYRDGDLSVPFVSIDDSPLVGDILGGNPSLAGVDKLCITTDERVGITRGEWERVLRFCAEHAGASS